MDGQLLSKERLNGLTKKITLHKAYDTSYISTCGINVSFVWLCFGYVSAYSLTSISFLFLVFN